MGPRYSSQRPYGRVHIGIHPLYDEKFDDIDKISAVTTTHQFAQWARGSWIGKYDTVDKTKQSSVFRAQLELARYHNMPIVSTIANRMPMATILSTRGS